MPISLTCSACGKRLKAPDQLAGKTLPCPACREKVCIPATEEEAAISSLLKDDPPAAPPVDSEEDRADETPPSAKPQAARPHVAIRPTATLPPLTGNELPLWQRHLHWILVLTLIPLAYSLLTHKSDKGDEESRLERTFKNASPETRERLARVFKNLGEGKGSIDDLFDALPDHKFAGALLPRNTWMHWGFALISVTLFMGFALMLAWNNAAQPPHLLGIGVFTATVGLLFLLLVQWLAAASQGVWLTGGNIFVLIFYIVKLIGFSYQAALDSENGFFLSFVGFTLGVGFCEEVCKALPLLWYYRNRNGQSWRGAFLWGLASGAGFGVAEGLMYSSRHYNGVSGGEMYLVRFISCVALHALWTGSVGITLNQKQELIQQELAWYEYIPPLFLIVGIPMVLHGLYDTLLKKEMTAAALGVAVLSFLFLAFQTSRLHGDDDEEAQEAMLREYKRRKALG